MFNSQYLIFPSIYSAYILHLSGIALVRLLISVARLSASTWAHIATEADTEAAGPDL